MNFKSLRNLEVIWFSAPLEKAYPNINIFFERYSFIQSRNLGISDFEKLSNLRMDSRVKSRLSTKLDEAFATKSKDSNRSIQSSKSAGLCPSSFESLLNSLLLVTELNELSPSLRVQMSYPPISLDRTSSKSKQKVLGFPIFSSRYINSFTS